MIGTWKATCANGNEREELLVSFDRGHSRRVLVLPAWFDEANKMRHFTVETMRALDEAGIDTFLPDLPGTNESLAPLPEQTIAGWREAAKAAAKTFRASHVLTIRAGALIAPDDLPGWCLAPQTGAKQLRGMIRARTIAAREEGLAESSDTLMEQGMREGLTLAGWNIGAAFFKEFAQAEPVPAPGRSEIAQSALGGPGLWLRAEPDHDPAQAAAFAGLIAASHDDADGTTP